MRTLLALFLLIAAAIGAQAQEINSSTRAPAAPAMVALDSRVAQAANVNAPTVYAVPTSGMYRLTCYIVLTQAATTSSTMPSCTSLFTDAATGTPLSNNNISPTATNNLVGTHAAGDDAFAAQQGSNIGYSTSSYASVGATPMQYQVRVVIERLQ